MLLCTDNEFCVMFFVVSFLSPGCWPVLQNELFSFARLPHKIGNVALHTVFLKFQNCPCQILVGSKFENI